MPLIFYGVDNNSVKLFKGFRESVNKCIKIINQFNMESGQKPLPFNNFDCFISYLSGVVQSKGYYTTDDIIIHRDNKDNKYHISQKKQKEILFGSKSKENIVMIKITDCLVNELIENHKGKDFIYNF
jgi:cell division GTPase FtsZ